MSVLTINEVAIFKCKFHELKLCKNQDYAMMTVSFEIQIGGEIKDWDTIPNQKSLLMESKNMNKFSGMIPGKAYHIKMACKFQRENNRNGKNYPAGITYEPLELMGEARVQSVA